MKLIIVAVVGTLGYEYYTGDKRVSKHVTAYMQKSGMQKHVDNATRKTASVYNKYIGDDLKKSNPKAAIDQVQARLKEVQEMQKKKEQELMDIENR
jgi:hypothetical protein